jgi:hypothetical protein
MVVRIPDDGLLDVIRKTDKGELWKNDTKTFESHYQHFASTEFWKKDASYKFILDAFGKIVNQKMKLLDVGCHVGALPIFLKKHNLWDKFEYSGTDIISNALEIAKKNFPDGNYFVADAQTITSKEHYDIVLSKGTIISTYYPDKALTSILDIPGKYVLLAHQPLFKQNKSAGRSFENILVVRENNMYTSTVLYHDYFMQELKKRNIRILKMTKRLLPVRIKNFQNYHLYDILLEKNAG